MTVKEYYNNGNLKSIEIFDENDMLIDSSIYYYENEPAVKAVKWWKEGEAYYEKDFFINGKLQREGRLLKDNFRVGKWTLYSTKGYLNEIIEYMDIGNKEYLNQSWKLDKNSDTLSGGNYYKLVRMKDTISYSDVNRIHFYLKQPIFQDSDVYVLIPKKGEDLKSNFENEALIKWDTVNSMSVVFRQHPIYSKLKYDVLFDIAPRRKGNDTIYGILLEKSTNTKVDYDFVTRKIYFKLPYFSK
jgi:hypothetical protein